MSKISLEDSDSWSCLSSVTRESPVTTHVFIVENFEDVLKDSKKAMKLESNVFEVENTKWNCYLAQLVPHKNGKLVQRICALHSLRRGKIKALLEINLEF